MIQRPKTGQRWVDFDRKGTPSSFPSPASETEAHLLNSCLGVGMPGYFKGKATRILNVGEAMRFSWSCPWSWNSHFDQSFPRNVWPELDLAMENVKYS